MIATDKIYIAGHRGMAGSAIARQLLAGSLSAQRLLLRTHNELDLTDQRAVRGFFQHERPGRVYLAAGKVGGIHANNTYPAEFIYQNLVIEANVIHEAFRAGVKKLLFLGSSCIYPKLASQPMPEGALLTGLLEPTNEPYAIAKIAGIKMCESYNRQYGKSHGVDYRSIMPTNLYGPGDNYDLLNCHVVAAMIRKLHLAKLAAAGNWHAIEHDEATHGPIPDDIKAQLHRSCNLNRAACISLWGTGTPRREFLHVDDMARACVHIMDLDRATYSACTQPMLSHVNVGFGSDISIAELAEVTARVVGFDGRIEYDSTKPDGTPRKLMDSSRVRSLGWRPNVELGEGLKYAYADYLSKGVAANANRRAAEVVA